MKKQGSSRLGRAGSIRSNIAEPEEVESLTAFPSGSAQTPIRVDQGDSNALKERSGSFRKSSQISETKSIPVARSYAQEIDRRIANSRSGEYVNDLMRNTAKKLPPTRMAATRTPVSKQRARSCPTSKLYVPPLPLDDDSPCGPLEETRRWKYSVDTSEVKMKPRDFARAIDARVKSDESSYTNDLLRQVERKIPSSRSKSFRYKRKPPRLSSVASCTIPESADFVQLEGLPLEDEIVSQGCHNDVSDMHSVANSSIASCSLMEGNDSFSIEFDQEELFAQQQQEQEMLELAMEMSRSSELERSRTDRVEQEMFELAMERSLAESMSSFQNFHR